MSQSTHAFYNCKEVDNDELFVDEYSDKVYFQVMSDEEDGVFLDKNNVQQLVAKLTNWIEKSNN